MDYRSRIYEKYATGFQNASTAFDFASATQWGKAYNYYFRGLLPAHKDAAIVDLACGWGRLLYFFTKRGYTHVNGVDISSEQVQIARQVIQDVYHENILDFLKKHENSFDLITGLDIIEHFNKNEVIDFFDLCYKSLKQGGRIIFQTPNADSPFVGTDRYGDFTHELGFTPRSLTNLLQMCHFNDILVREQGPVIKGYSLKASFRSVVWQIIRSGLKLWNLVETGNTGSNIFSRTFLVSGIKA